jgi:hypothetical protein
MLSILLKGLIFRSWILNNDVNISQLATKGIQHVPRIPQLETRTSQLATRNP